MPAFCIRSAAVSEIGRTRENNEDAIICDDDLGLYAVLDGMGGHQAGEIASNTTAAALQRRIKDRGAEIARLGTQDATDSDVIRFMEEIIGEVASEIHALSMSDPDYSHMGTTLTLVLLLADNRVVMGHVGDSRLYILRDGQAHQLSDDHTYGSEMVRSALMSPEDIGHSPYGNALTRAVGLHPAVLIDTLLFGLQPDDVLVICSDGLHNYLETPDQLDEIIDPESLQGSAEKLVDWANSKGGRDNISAVLISATSDLITMGSGTDAFLRERETINFLRRTPLFADLHMRDLLHLAILAEYHPISANHVLQEKGQLCAGYGMVVRGRLRAGSRTIGPGESFSFEGLLENALCFQHVEAECASEILVLPRAPLNHLLYRRPRLAHLVYRALALELLSRNAEVDCTPFPITAKK